MSIELPSDLLTEVEKQYWGKKKKKKKKTSTKTKRSPTSKSTQLSTEDSHIAVMKSTNEALRQATFLVLEPQDEDMTTSDLHGDWYSEEDVFKACRAFNDTEQKANLLHMIDTNGFRFIESYVTLGAFDLGDSHIKKGSWLATIQCEADYIWEGILDGTFNGLSIQCYARTEDLE